MKDVTNSTFWRERLDRCGGDLQRAMMEGSSDQFAAVHRDQMLRLHRADIQPTDSVLDVGCGYGRLLTMMPTYWKGPYCGVDVSPDLIAVARILYPGRRFVVGDCTRLDEADGVFDVAVAVWLKTMLCENGLAETWERVHAEMHRVARRVVVIW